MDDIPEGEQRLYLLRLRDEADGLTRDAARLAALADAAARGEPVPPGMLPLHLDRYVEAMVREAPEPAPVTFADRIAQYLRAVRGALDHVRVEVAVLLRWRGRR